MVFLLTLRWKTAHGSGYGSRSPGGGGGGELCELCFWSCLIRPHDTEKAVYFSGGPEKPRKFDAHVRRPRYGNRHLQCSHVNTFHRGLLPYDRNPQTQQQHSKVNMRLPHLSILKALALVPSLVSSSLYPKDSLVKMVDTRGFRNAMKENVRDIAYSSHSRF